MKAKDKYFELIYTARINEYIRIDDYKKWERGTAKGRYKTLDEFYQEELFIKKEELADLRVHFQKYHQLRVLYFSETRVGMFQDAEKFLEWFESQDNRCNYCELSQEDLRQIVKSRSGNLTLNQKTKRSKGTLEIEKLNPSEGYIFSNCVLSCPFCNNAKSNLICEGDWREFFVPAMKSYVGMLRESKV